MYMYIHEQCMLIYMYMYCITYHIGYKVDLNDKIDHEEQRSNRLSYVSLQQNIGVTERNTFL